MDIGDLANKFKDIADNTSDIITEVFEVNRMEFVDLNTSQLELGLTNRGTLIKPNYASKVYSALKKRMGKRSPGDTADLKFKGDFHKEIDFVVLPSGKEGQLTSFDEKTAMLEEKYKNIFGLSSNSNKKVVPKLRKTMGEKLKEKLK